MNKKIMISMMMLFAIPFCVGTINSWNYEIGQSGQKTLFGTGDTIFSTYYGQNFTIPDGTIFGNAEPLIGNIYTQNLVQEIITHGSCGILVIEATNYTQISNYSLCNEGRTISGYALIDWNNDGKNEIFVTSYSGANGFVNVLNLNDSADLISTFNGTTTYSTQGKHPVCTTSYPSRACYIQDINSNVYRFFPNGTKTQLNLGSLTAITDETWLIVDDCNPTSGIELLAYGDFDGDGILDDISVISLTTFIEIDNIYTSVSSFDFVYPPTCGIVDGIPIITVPSGYYNCIQYAPFNYHLQANFFTYLINQSNMAVRGSYAPSYTTFGLGGTCPWSSNPMSYEMNSNAVFDFVPNKLCFSARSNVADLGIQCLNEDATLNITASTTSSFGNNYFISQADVNNDGTNEIINSRGIVYRYNGGVINKYHEFISEPSKNTRGWI